MIAVEVQVGSAGRWRALSHAGDYYAAAWQMFGWMAVYSGPGTNNSWRTTEVDNMGTVAELVGVLRSRQQTLDAPAVVEACETAGVGLMAVGDSIKVRGRLPADLRERLVANKPAVLRILNAFPPWDDAEALTLSQKAKTCAQAAERHLADPKCVFAQAGRTILADALGAIERARACGRLDLMRRRVDWVIGWAGTLDRELLSLREPPAGERAEAYAVRAAVKTGSVAGPAPGVAQPVRDSQAHRGVTP